MVLRCRHQEKKHNVVQFQGAQLDSRILHTVLQSMSSLFTMVCEKKLISDMAQSTKE